MWDEMPEELLFLIFRFLNPGDLFNVALLNKTTLKVFHSMIMSRRYWRDLDLTSSNTGDQHFAGRLKKNNLAKGNATTSISSEVIPFISIYMPKR